MTCGGCGGLGAHTRWCESVVGAEAHLFGTTADGLTTCGDMLRATARDTSDLCHMLATLLLIRAELATAAHKAGQP